MSWTRCERQGERNNKNGSFSENRLELGISWEWTISESRVTDLSDEVTCIDLVKTNPSINLFTKKMHH